MLSCALSRFLSCGISLTHTHTYTHTHTLSLSPSLPLSLISYGISLKMTSKIIIPIAYTSEAVLGAAATNTSGAHHSKLPWMADDLGCVMTEPVSLLKKELSPFFVSSRCAASLR